MNNISVIMPIYNAEKYLKKSINSILNQTYKDFELILVNDGSKDNSLNVCNKYASKDNRIKVVNQSNSGSILARKKGLKNAKGKYVIFIDADDWVDSRLIEKLYFEINKSKSDIVVCKKNKTLNLFTFIQRDVNSHFNSFYSKQSVYKNEEIKNRIVKSFLFSGCFPCELTARIYKRDLFDNTGEYNKNIHFFGEDLYWNLEIFLKAEKVTLLDEVLYYYRKGGGTSNYMPYHFDDIVCGIKEKEKIVLKYYNDSKEDIYVPMYMNFLELYKASLFNLLYSNYDESSIKNIIQEQLDNEIVIKIAKFMQNVDFDKEFVKAILYPSKNR